VPESDETNNTIAIPVTVGKRPVVSSLTGVPGQAAAQQLRPGVVDRDQPGHRGAASGSFVPCCAQTDHGTTQYNNNLVRPILPVDRRDAQRQRTFIGEYFRPDNFTLAAGTSYTASASIHVPSVAPAPIT